MVAVVVLLAVIIATSKIFSTASKVTSTGEATADVLQQAGVIEEQIRRDLANITQDGYMAIQCVAVRNDVNRVTTGLANAPLVNPELLPSAIIRADTIVFFTAGGETTMRWSGPNDTSAYGGNQQARSSRVFYGHGVQFPQLGNDPAGTGAVSVKPIIQGMGGGPAGANQITPWKWGDPSNVFLRWQWGTANNTSGGMPRISPNQPGAREWVLCRKSTLMADDGGRTLYYPDPAANVLNTAVSLGPTSAPSVFGDRTNTTSVGYAGGDSQSGYLESRGRSFVPLSTNIIPSPMLQSGWVDIAASELDEIRRFISPTLTLSTPVDIPSSAAPEVTLRSLSVPWVAQNGAAPPDSTPYGAPMGWPAGTLSWPWGSSVVGPHLPSPAAVGGFSSQRDRIIRGTFGPVNTSTQFPSAAYNNVGLAAWPRAEKALPNSDRRSEVLTTPVLSNNCSSFQIDWTWERGTGRQTDATGAPLAAINRLGPGASSWVMRGYEPDAGAWNNGAGDFSRVPQPQPWFGFPDTGSGAVVPLPNQRMGVTLAQFAMPVWVQPGVPANSTNLHMGFVAQSIEGIPGNNFIPALSFPFGASVPVCVYTAVFGFNQDQAYLVTPDGLRVLRDDFTPWPTQLRFTLTLHDPRLVLDRGREFQFVLDIPKRKK